MHGTYEANMSMYNCDLMICVGARFDDRITGKVSGFSPKSKKVHFDIGKSWPPFNGMFPWRLETTSWRSNRQPTQFNCGPEPHQMAPTVWIRPSSISWGNTIPSCACRIASDVVGNWIIPKARQAQRSRQIERLVLVQESTIGDMDHCKHTHPLALPEKWNHGAM